MTGVNRHPLPHGNVSSFADGRTEIHAAGGRTYQVDTHGRLLRYSSQDTQAVFRTNGEWSSIQKHNMVIKRGSNGGRRIESNQSDGSLLVSQGSNSGYLERRATVAGRPGVERTYYRNGSSYRRTYQTYDRSGVSMQAYVPPVRFSPNYLNWMSTGWSSAVSYDWGMSGEPWYNAYGRYWAPAPSYTDPAMWVVDWELGQILEQAYKEDGTPGKAASQPISEQDKEQLAKQVADRERFLASPSGQSDPGSASHVMLAPGEVFVVSDSLSVQVRGQDCELTAGDFLRLTAAVPGNSASAAVIVADSKPSDCARDSQVEISVQDLQNMHNVFLDRQDGALRMFSLKQGRDGLPTAPNASITVTDRAPKDEGVGQQLENQQREAGQTEQELLNSLYPDEHA